MSNQKIYNVLGVGIGPFNLSLAALLTKEPKLTGIFFDSKKGFDWHSEVMFSDSVMQTNYLKDLVTPVDPTSPYSYLNYLVQNKLFYSFLNTQRTAVTRKEFEMYCKWVTHQLADKLNYETFVETVKFNKDHFEVGTSQGTYLSQNICVATGLSPRIINCAQTLLSDSLFHAKSDRLSGLDITNKRVLIVGGGQTGIEIFRNALKNKWGRPHSLKIITRRKSLEPLDETAFTNEYFTPEYVEKFWNLDLKKKTQIVTSQKLASDGNTPKYLLQLYNDLFQLKHVEKDQRPISIMASRAVQKIEKINGGYKLQLDNSFKDQQEEVEADIVILCTGFENRIPAFLDPIRDQITFDSEGRFVFEKNYAICWKGNTKPKNKIYALNFSRHNHGIVDPQTSLMAWRSAVIVNDIAQTEVYDVKVNASSFVE